MRVPGAMRDRGTANRVVLLRLLGVERGLLGLQLGNQFFGAVDRHLIADREQYALISRNRFVDLLALLTHDQTVRIRNRSGSRWPPLG